MRWRLDQGISAVEVMVATTLMVAVVAVVGPVMASSFGSGATLQDESRAADELKLAVERIDREVRAAECIHAPAAGSSGSLLSFRTHVGTGGPFDVSYRVEDGDLVRRVDGDQTVAEGLVASGSEFTHSASVGSRAKIAIAFDVAVGTSGTRHLETTITGRNAWTSC